MEVVIVSAARTPVGNLNGALSSLAAHELGSVAIKEALKRAGIQGEDVSEVILGQVLTAGEGQNPARQASIGAGIPYTVPAINISMVCGSGLRAVAMAEQAVMAGDAKVVVAGGQESMSKAPHCVHIRAGTKVGDVNLVDIMVKDGLTDAFSNNHMGISAEKAARQWNVTRQEQDQFALQSQQKCEAAQNAGHFDQEIVPVVIQSRTGTTEVKKDEFPRAGCTLEGLQKLRPAFIRDSTGTVTAGNASGMNDCAAVVVVMSAAEARERKVQPLARIVSWVQAGVDPSVRTGPNPAVRPALNKAGWTVEEVELFEVNEGFAVQALAVVKDLGCDLSKVNVSGGAVALGHPLGASSARILVTLLYNLKRTGKKKGLAALCVGGGMGLAMCVQTL